MGIAALIIVMKLTKPVRDMWDYAMIGVGVVLIGASLYRLFIKK